MPPKSNNAESIIDEEVVNLLEKRCIDPSSSPYSFPITLAWCLMPIPAEFQIHQQPEPQRHLLANAAGGEQKRVRGIFSACTWTSP